MVDRNRSEPLFKTIARRFFHLVNYYTMNVRPIQGVFVSGENGQEAGRPVRGVIDGGGHNK